VATEALHYDESTVNSMPEPSATAPLFPAGLAVFALGRRRIR
jgi:MYXO-CTERM domain-containing protein